MKKENSSKIAVTVRLTHKEAENLNRLCALRKMTRTGYLTQMATQLARKDLLDHAIREYREGKASLSELAKNTGLDAPTIMDGIVAVSGEDHAALDAFLAAAKTLSKWNKDPEFYELAVKAVS
jgi:hypothetical protein